MLQVYFSPNGTTRETVETITRAYGGEWETLDLLTRPLEAERRVAAEETLVVGMPVYAGRIPGLCREMLSRLKGAGGAAVAAVVYGNRDYDDALLELTDLLEENGFHVVGAGAFLAQHSIFPRTGAGRPDENDKRILAEFGQNCAARVNGGGPAGEIHVKGKRPYQKAGSVVLKPSGDKRCISCGACARLCPTHSIAAERPRETDRATCISCGACIHICPTGARGWRGVAYKTAEAAFCKMCSAYRKPELFYPQA